MHINCIVHLFKVKTPRILCVVSSSPFFSLYIANQEHAKPSQLTCLWLDFTIARVTLQKIPLLTNIWFQMRKAPPYLGSTAKAVVVAVGVLLVVLEIGLVRLKWQGRHRMIVKSHPLKSPPSATVLSYHRFRSPDAGLPANLSLQPSLSSEMCPEVLARRPAPGEQKNYTCKDVSTQPSAPQNDGTDVQAALTAVLATAEGLVSPLTGDILTSRSLVSPAEEDIIEIATVLDLPRVSL